MEKDDLLLSLSLIFRAFFSQKDSRAGNALSRALKIDNKTEGSYLFNAGRSAFFLALKALALKKGDEVLLPAFSCVANINSVLWAGLTPVLVDLHKDNVNLSWEDLEKKISNKSKVLLIQHTFGYPADMERILSIAKTHGLVLFEDCAHSFDSQYKKQKIGTFGDMAFFSFGRDKALSSVFGGALTVKTVKLNKKVRKLYSGTVFPPRFWVLKNLFYPLYMELVLKCFTFLSIGKFSLGKALLYLYQKSTLLPLPVEDKEKKFGRPKHFPAKMAPEQAELAWQQYQKLNKYRARKQSFVRLWTDSLKKLGISIINTPGAKLDLLRLPIFIPSAQKIILSAKNEGLYLGDWYRPAIAPKGNLALSKFYNPKLFPNAEKQSGSVVNLPLCPRFSKKEQQEVCRLFVKIYNDYDKNRKYQQ